MEKELNTEMTVKMTDWKNEPTLMQLRNNIDDADTDTQLHASNVERWLKNMEAPRRAKEVGRSSVVPKVIRTQAEWRYPSLSNPFLSTPDLFNVSPTSAGDRKRAQQNEMVLNNQLNTKINKVAFIDDVVRDFVDIGTVIVEVGWVNHEEEVEEEVPVYSFVPTNNLDTAERYTQLARLRQTSGDLYNQYMNPGLDQAIDIFLTTGQLVDPVQTGTRTEKKVVETKNHPVVEVCDSANILIDPTCDGDLDKARFVGKRHKASLSELKADGRYTNLDKIQVEGNHPISVPEYAEGKDIMSFQFEDKPRKQFVVHTYWGDWDIHGDGTTVPIVASWVGKTLIRMEENPFPFKRPPFAIAANMPVRRSAYGQPDGELLEDNQEIIGAVTRGIIDILGRSANSQIGTKQGFLDAVNLRKFKRGEDYQFNSQGRPEESIFMHTYPEIPASAYNMIQMHKAEAESLTGVKAFSTGINAQAMGQSVGGGRDALDAASKREAGALNRLSECLKHVGRMFIAMNAVFLSEEEVVRITDEQFVTVRRDDLSGSFDISLTISTAEEDNKKAEELAFMLQTTGNNMDMGLRNMILSDIARLRKMPGLAKRIEEYKPEPDPLAQAEAEMKIHLLKAQIAKEEALAMKHATEAEANGMRGFKDRTQGQLNIAKAGSEGAKERSLHSDADNKDLDYLDRATGAAHEREKDLEGFKASIKPAPGRSNN